MQALLLRYADTDGYVTSRAVDGVVRLAELGARQTAALSAWAKVRDTDEDAATDDSRTAEIRPGDSLLKTEAAVDLTVPLRSGADHMGQEPDAECSD